MMILLSGRSIVPVTTSAATTSFAPYSYRNSSAISSSPVAPVTAVTTMISTTETVSCTEGCVTSTLSPPASYSSASIASAISYSQSKASPFTAASYNSSASIYASGSGSPPSSTSSVPTPSVVPFTGTGTKIAGSAMAALLAIAACAML